MVRRSYVRRETGKVKSTERGNNGSMEGPIEILKEERIERRTKLSRNIKYIIIFLGIEDNKGNNLYHPSVLVLSNACFCEKNALVRFYN